VFYVATVVLAYFDSRMLQRLGFRVWWWLAIMPFPFIYLWHRTKRARGPVEILAIWAIAGLIVALFNQLNPEESSGETYQLDHTVVESKIEAQYARDGRYTDLRCHFPMVGEIGDTFRCDANIGETWWEVRVTMQGNNRWKWSETG